MPATYLGPGARIVQLTDALVETRMCVAITSDGHFIPDTLRSRKQALENGYRPVGESEFEVAVEPVAELEFEAVLVGLPCGGSYFHWLFEAVTRALLGSRSASPSVRFLVPPLRPMERDALLTAGIPEECLHEMPTEGAVAVKSLLVPPRGIHGPCRFLPVAVDALHSLAADTGKLGARVYISRRGGHRRRIANETELEDLLARHGFISVEAQTLSVREQIAVFADAEAIISNHGGGLTNAVFARPGSLLVELQPPRLGAVRIMLFWNLASLRDLRYVQIVCPLAPGQADVPDPSRDIVVDCAHLDGVLRQHLEVP